MHIKNKPPVLVPHEHRAELEKLSKAALMDLAYDLACVAAETDCPDRDSGAVMAKLRMHREAVLAARQ